MTTRIRNHATNSRIGKRLAIILAIPTVVIVANATAALANGGLAYQRR